MLALALLLTGILARTYELKLALVRRPHFLYLSSASFALAICAAGLSGFSFCTCW